MFKPLALFIGLRYTRAKRRNHFISFISATSIGGIALGIIALITVLSVMNGFEKELRERILGMASHSTISGRYGLYNWHELGAKVMAHPRVIGVAPYIDGQAMLTYRNRASGILIRGILPDEEPKVTDLAAHVVKGKLADLQPGKYGIILGNELADMLGVALGEKITLLVPQASVTPAGVLPRVKRFTVTAIFKMGMYEFDSKLALIHLEDAAKLYRQGNAVTGLRLKLDDMFASYQVGKDLKPQIPASYRMRDWTEHHANFFAAITTEKRAMFIILLLIVAVAAFNIVSTLVMVVTDKEREIAVLRTLGASPGSIMMIFIIQGTVLGFVGCILGVVGGIALALNVETIVPAIEKFFGHHFMDPRIYYISKLPSDVHLKDVIQIGVTAFLLTVMATIYPAWRASKTEPAEALRYE